MSGVEETSQQAGHSYQIICVGLYKFAQNHAETSEIVSKRPLCVFLCRIFTEVWLPTCDCKLVQYLWQE